MGLDKTLFVTGAFEKYGEELLKGRVEIEANVVFSLWKDPLIIDENKLDKSCFLTRDGKFYYSLAKNLRSKNLVVFDEVSVLSNSTEEVIAKFNSLGGYEVIENMCSLVSLSNWDSYSDMLNRENIILKLHDNGFNLTKEVEYKDKKIVPIQLFRRMNSEQVIDWYDMFLSSCSTGYSSLVLEDEMIDIDDNFLDGIEKGEEQGISFRSAGLDIEGNEMMCYPYISDEIGGYREGTFNLLCGHSSTGKSSVAVAIILSMLSQGRKCLIISNEQKKKVFQVNFLVWLLYKRNHYYKLTKKKIMNGELTLEDKKQLASVQKYWREQGYDKMVKFISITDANTPVVKKKIRENVLRHGVSFVFYDTMKIDFSSSADKKEYISLIQDSRDFDAIAKKYNIIMLASLQLSLATLGQLFLDASALSGAKAVKECAESIIMMRTLYSEELIKNNKVFCEPFRTVKVEDGKYINQEYEPDPSAVWRVVFIDKSRSSSNSSDTGIAYLFKMNGNFCVFTESAKCFPKHGRIQ